MLNEQSLQIGKSYEIGMFNETNKLVEGFQVEPDVFPKWD
jgi:hypothetical protein